MSDQPEHPTPTFSPRFIGWAVASAAVAAVAAVGIAVGEPPSPYRALLSAAIVCGVLVGCVLVLADLVLHVSGVFGRKYAAAEQAAIEYQEAMAEILSGISANQAQILAMISKLDERAQQICKTQKILHNKVNRCMGEVGILNDGLGELREAFVEEGLPERDQLGTGRRGPGSRAGHHSILTRSGSNRYPFHSFAG